MNERTKEIDQLYLKYFTEYIEQHGKETIGLYELTNRAINYCQEKLNLPSRMPVDEIVKK